MSTTVEQVDVLVVGGGPAGATAAIAAARAGAQTLLVERYGFLGGNMAASTLGDMCGFYTCGEAKDRVIGGIGWEIVLRLAEMGGAEEFLEDRLLGVVPYNHELYKFVLERLAHDAGAHVLYHTCAVDVEQADSEVRGVVVENKGGRTTIKAGVVIDATGDADVAVRAGVPFQMDHNAQAMTTTFMLGNVDSEKAVGNQELKALMREAIESGSYPLPRHHGNYRWVPGMPGVVALNVTRVNGKDGVDPEQLAQAETEGREQVLLYADFIRQHARGFENSFLVSLGVQIGVRETRRIEGLYTMTENDVVENRRFQDSIGQNGWPIEIHSPESTGTTDWTYTKGGNSHDIPYRSILPNGVDRLLVVGRCASATHVAQAATRVTGPCTVMGHAAGVAAAMASASGRSPAHVDAEELRERLAAERVLFATGSS